MTASTGDLPATDTIAGSGPRKSLLALRIVAVVFTVVAFAQPVLAGLFIGGTADVVEVHAMVGMSVSALALIQLITAIVYVWRGRGQRLALYTAIGIFLVAEGANEMGWASGDSRGLLSVHIPLAVVAISAQLVFTLWTFHGSAREARTAK